MAKNFATDDIEFLANELKYVLIPLLIRKTHGNVEERVHGFWISDDTLKHARYAIAAIQSKYYQTILHPQYPRSSSKYLRKRN